MALQQSEVMVALSPRSERPAVTDQFAPTWASVEPALRRFLAARGLGRHDIDDIVQEVAARVLEHGVSYQTPDDLRAWCFVVARRLHIDQWRAQSRGVPLDDHTADSDLRQESEIRRVEDRHFLGTVSQAFTCLSDGDRLALVTDTRGVSGQERNRLAVARHRARGRLKAMTGPFGLSPVLFAHLSKAQRRSLPAQVGVGVLSVAVFAVVHTVAAPRPGDAPAFGRADAQVTPWAAREVRAQLGVRVASVPAVVPVVTSHSHVVATATDSPVAAVAGPRGAWARVALKANDGHQPLVCTDGSFVQHACLDIPSGTPAHDTAGTGSGTPALVTVG